MNATELLKPVYIFQSCRKSKSDSILWPTVYTRFPQTMSDWLCVGNFFHLRVERTIASDQPLGTRCAPTLLYSRIGRE